MYPNFYWKAFFSINWYSLIIKLFCVITFHLILHFMNLWIFEVYYVRHIAHPKNHIAFLLLTVNIRHGDKRYYFPPFSSPSEFPKLLTVNLWQILGDFLQRLWHPAGMIKNESGWINYTALCQWIFIKFHQGTTNSERHHAGSNFNKSALTARAIHKVPWEFDFPTMGLIQSNYETGSFCGVAEIGARSVGTLKMQLATL